MAVPENTSLNPGPLNPGPLNPGSLAVRLCRQVVAHLDALASSVMPDWRVPAVLAGHRVGPDVRAELAWTLTLLARDGVTEVGGHDPTSVARHLLTDIDGSATHTFSSYRVGEAVARLGSLESWPEASRAGLEHAVDSTGWVSLLDSGALPANYAAVLARCELARQGLGIPIDTTVLDDLVGRTATLLGSAGPHGFVDDDPSGGGRYDIYSVDLYLFTEPFADRLDHWADGVRAVAGAVVDTVGRLGAVVPWGRSTGLLGLCHTIELAALVVDRGLTDEPERWIAHAAGAAAHLDGWFADGLTTAHQHRSPYRYRGPARRLQLTLDTLGKLAWSAGVLARTAGFGDTTQVGDTARSDETADAAGTTERWVPFEDRRPLGVWIHRSPKLGLVVPVTGTVWSDYLPAPRNPGLFETPVDRPLVAFGPTAFWGEVAHTAAGVPQRATSGPGNLELDYAGWTPLGDLSSPTAPVASAGDEGDGPGGGRRRVRLAVEGRTLRFDEHWTFATPPDALVIQVPETPGRPLVVEVEAQDPATHTVDTVDTVHTVDTDGLSEWRSFWGPLPRVHQVEVTPAAAVSLSWSVTPALTVATDGHHHWYHRSLYDPMVPWVRDRPLHRDRFEGAGAPALLEGVDVYHLHWPEWVFDTDEAAARRFVDLLASTGTALVWTQHNLVPHRAGDFAGVYATIAAAADAVIHHSAWGRDRAQATYTYGAHTRHEVIPHGHWGRLMNPTTAGTRAEAEAELGLAPCALRIGIVGAPRPGKDTVGFLEAVVASGRDDVAVVALSLEDHELASVPDDPRVHAAVYEFVDRATWDRRLAAFDLLAFPFAPDTPMLTTGVFADAVGAGLPALVSGWGFLAEVLGDAGLPMGDTPEEWARAVAALDAEAVARAAAVSAELRAAYDWTVIARRTRDLLDDVAPPW